MSVCAALVVMLLLVKRKTVRMRGEHREERVREMVREAEEAAVGVGVVAQREGGVEDGEGGRGAGRGVQVTQEERERGRDREGRGMDIEGCGGRGMGSHDANGVGIVASVMRNGNANGDVPVREPGESDPGLRSGQGQAGGCETVIPLGR